MAKPEEMYQCQTVTCGYINNPDKGGRKGKIPKGAQFADFRTTGNARYAVQARNCSSPLQDGSLVAGG